MTNKWSEAGIQLKYASGVAGHYRRLRRRNNAASKRLCHATRDDISIAGSPPTGEDDGKNTHVILAAPVSSFPPKAGLTNKWSEAGIQLKYASGVAGLIPAGEDDGGEGNGNSRQRRELNMSSREA